MHKLINVTVAYLEKFGGGGGERASKMKGIWISRG